MERGVCVCVRLHDLEAHICVCVCVDASGGFYLIDTAALARSVFPPFQVTKLFLLSNTDNQTTVPKSAATQRDVFVNPALV